MVSVIVAVALAAGLSWTQWRHPADIRDGTTAVSSEEMSARYGIGVELIAVTAAGGLIELKLQVSDPDKADDVMHEEDQLPVLVDEATGATLIMSSPPHHRDELQLGGEYFFLLANTRSALQRGSLVTMVVGDARLEHIEVQG